MAAHRADASSFLDNRGYKGPLVRGVNPATLFEKAVRDRITDSYYWKEQCFGLNAATLCDRAVELTSIGGTYGVSEKPTPFLCLAFKLLQLGPDRDVILELLNYTDPGSGDEAEDPDSALVKDRGDFKYLRALAAFYVRLTFDPGRRLQDPGTTTARLPETEATGARHFHPYIYGSVRRRSSHKRPCLRY